MPVFFNYTSMKTLILTLLAVITIAFVSCDLTGESNYTPQIYFIHQPVDQQGDTLSSYYTDKAGVFVMDTIEVGDTVLFYLYLEAYANQLTAFYLNQSADSVSSILLPSTSSMDSVFVEGSDYHKGKFIMDGTRNSLRFPFWYVAKKPSVEAKIEFIVVSNAKFEGGFASNANSLQLKTPIQAAD